MDYFAKNRLLQWIPGSVAWPRMSSESVRMVVESTARRVLVEVPTGP